MESEKEILSKFKTYLSTTYTYPITIQRNDDIISHYKDSLIESYRQQKIPKHRIRAENKINSIVTKYKCSSALKYYFITLLKKAAIPVIAICLIYYVIEYIL